MSDLRTMVTGDLAFGADAQVAILVHMAHDPAMHDIAERLGMDIQDFDLPTCRVVYEALRNFYDKYHTLPPIEVLAREVHIVATNQRGDAESDPLTAAEAEGLVIILDRIARPGQLAPEYYRDELLRYVKAIRTRKLHMEAAEAIQQGTGVDDFLQRASALGDLQSDSTMIPMSDVFEDSRLLMERQAVMRIPSGLFPLDKALYGGLAVGEVALVVACTGVGKTNTMINVAKSAAAKGWHTLLVNTEMKEPDIRHRTLAMTGHIDAKWWQIPLPEWPDAELIRLSTVRNCPYRGRIMIADLSVTDAPTMNMVERAIKQWRTTKEREGNLAKAKVVLLDWIGEIKPKASYVGRDGSDLGWQGFAGNMKDFTRMIRKYECCGWTATQATRDADGVKFLSKRHVAFGVRQLDSVDVAISVTANDDDKMVKRHLNDDNVEAADGVQPCDRDLLFSTMKNRRFAPTSFPIYQGSTLGYFATKQAKELMDRRVQEDPFCVGRLDG